MAFVTLQSGTAIQRHARRMPARRAAATQSRANCIGDPFAGATTDPSQLAGATAPGFFLNPAAFSLCRNRHLWQLALRGRFHGPGLENLDLSIFKNFADHRALQSGIPQRVLQHVQPRNFNNPSANAAPRPCRSFGKLLSTIGDPREIQFALKFYF